MRARIATGLVLAAAAAAVTLWSPAWLFAALTLALMLAALVEWSRLGQAAAPASVVIAITLVIAALLLLRAPQKLPMVCLAGLLFWAYQAGDLIVRKTQPRPETGPKKITSNLVQGGFIFLFAWAALWLMRLEQGAALTVAMLLVVWSADTFAYIAGKSFGRHKLAPSISPGKTIEGLLGGLAGAGLVALLAAVALELDAARTLCWLLAAVIAALFGVIGDLYESRLKRHAGVKDSGHLLPGHGGLLDRIDGLLAATPAFVTVWRLSA